MGHFGYHGDCVMECFMLIHVLNGQMRTIIKTWHSGFQQNLVCSPRPQSTTPSQFQRGRHQPDEIVVLGVFLILTEISNLIKCSYQAGP